jgi:RNA polymerase primary sigma factor
MLKELLDTPPRTQVINFPEDFDLCKRTRSSDEEIRTAALEELYDKFHSLMGMFAYNMANRVDRSGAMDIDDLRQEALIYMIKQAETYDGSIPFKNWLGESAQHRLAKAITEQATTVRLPVHIDHKVRGINAINDSRMRDGHHIMTPEEMSKEFNLSIERCSRKSTVYDVARAMLLTRYMGSIDTGFDPHTDDSPGNNYTVNEMHILKLVAGQSEPGPDEIVMQSLLREKIAEVLSTTMSELQAKVISMRFGFEDGQPKTLEEVGEAIGATRGRVYQIESKALRILQRPANKRLFQDFLG